MLLLSYCTFWLRKFICKFRTSNHKLRIEIGRFGKNRVDRDQRLCEHCTMGVVENESHFLLECPYYRFERYDFLRIIARHVNVDRAPLSNEETCIEILSSPIPEVIIALAKFSRLAIDRATTIGWVEQARTTLV